MIALEWDPDRYDYLSENRLFLISWSIWDYTEFAEIRVLSFFCWFPIFKAFAVVATQFIWTVRTSFPGFVSSEVFNCDMSDSFADLVGTSSGSHLQQSGDPTDETETCLQWQQLLAPSASDLQLFGGDEVTCASPSPFLGT